MEEARRALKPFARAGYELIPLARGRKNPRDEGWRFRTYTLPEIGHWLGRGGNAGIRLRDVDLVIDADPRNYAPGDDPLNRLSAAVGADLAAAPTVASGRGDGGRHHYFRKPAALRVVGKLADYPGLDFKSAGGFVVGPGSRHPSTGGIYMPDDITSPAITDVANAPEALLAMLARPDFSAPTGDRVGRITNEQLADLLAVLDPTKYGPGHHDAWFALMAAAHDATTGHGLAEWLAWCARDSIYDNPLDEEATTRRWHSLTAGKSGGTSFRTLLRAVADAGRADLVAALGDDDDDVLEEDFAVYEIETEDDHG